jgi:VWFA-related protein
MALFSIGGAAEHVTPTVREGIGTRLQGGPVASSQEPARGGGSDPSSAPEQGSASQGQPQSQPQDQQQPAAEQPPVFRAEINFVRVDVTVTDRSGSTVSDLQQEDFEISEDGEPQKIEQFKLIALDGGATPDPGGPPRIIRSEADEETEAARDDVRLFGIFLDDYHVRRETSIGARQQLLSFMEAELGPSDMIGVMYPLAPLSEVRFTRSRGAVAGALQQFVGRKYDYTPMNAAEERYAHYPTETVERIRNQVSLSAIEGMVIRMGSLKEGRKALILVSEGYTNMVPPQLRSQVAGLPDPTNPAYGDPLAGANSPLEDRAAMMAASDMEMDLRNVYAAASRNNVAIYALDPRGLAAAEFGIDQNIGSQVDRSYLDSTMNTLRTLAAETDGRAIVNRNDLATGLRQIVRDSSAYYLLGYTSTVGAIDGKFHDIRVRVRRPGVEVRARKGYWAHSVESAARATALPKPGPPKAVETALAAIAPIRSRLVRTWIGSARGDNGRTSVTFLWEPVARTPGDARAASEVPARVMLTAASADGEPYYRGRVAPTAPPAPGSVPAGSQITFQAKPGTLQLRVAVEGADSEVLDAVTQEVVIPDLTASQTALGTPAVFRARTARELQQIQADPQVMPTAVREFSRTERLLVRLPAYGPGGSAPVVSARLLSRGGEAMLDLKVAADAKGSSMEVPLAALAPGEYLVEIKAGGQGAEATELVAFRVTG